MPFSSAPPTLLYENPAGRLLADSKGFLRTEWRPVSAEPAAVQQLLEQELLEQELHLLKKTGWGRILSNQALQCPLATETLDWLLTEWLPRAAALCSFRWGALLVADEEQALVARRFVAEKVSGQYRIQFQFFMDEARAEQWLLAQY